MLLPWFSLISVLRYFINTKIIGDNICEICHEGDETTMHALWDCSFANMEWRQNALPAGKFDKRHG